MMNSQRKQYAPLKTSVRANAAERSSGISKSNSCFNTMVNALPWSTVEASDFHVNTSPGESFLQRKFTECAKGDNQPKNADKPPVQVSNSTAEQIQSSKGNGASLNNKTSAFMSSRTGLDFSDVKIHTDTAAEKFSKELNAKAFTIGRDIYFDKGQFQPDTKAGQHLLAHELTHVVQQNRLHSDQLIQRACYEDDNTSIDMPACPEGAQSVGRQAQGQGNKLDANAKAIIATASGSGSNADKAIQVVKDIICTYMPTQAGKVRKISYYAAQVGLGTQSIGSGSGARGDICVGDNFLNSTTNAGISRRVLQVEHELEHIEQYRSGLAGANNRRLREFLAFYKEALADEFIGTGRMSHNTRKALIDGALGEYNCLTDEQKASHSSKQQELLARRETVNGTNGNPSTNPPVACVRSS